MLFTYNEKVECQQKCSDTEPTKAIVGRLNCLPRNGNLGIPGPAEPVIRSDNTRISDFDFENTDERWQERRKS